MKQNYKTQILYKNEQKEIKINKNNHIARLLKNKTW